MADGAEPQAGRGLYERGIALALVTSLLRGWLSLDAPPGAEGA